MSDLTITIGSSSTSSSGSGVTTTASNNTVTMTPNTSAFGVTLVPAAGCTFLGSITLPSVTSVTFSPTVVGISSGQYVFSCTDNVSSGNTSNGSFNVVLTTVTAAGSTMTATRYPVYSREPHVATITHDPTLILNPPG